MELGVREEAGRGLSLRSAQGYTRASDTPASCARAEKNEGPHSARAEAPGETDPSSRRGPGAQRQIFQHPQRGLRTARWPAGRCGSPSGWPWRNGTESARGGRTRRATSRGAESRRSRSSAAPAPPPQTHGRFTSVRRGREAPRPRPRRAGPPPAGRSRRRGGRSPSESPKERCAG